MITAPEQFAALNTSNLETAFALANVSLEGAQRLVDLQLKAAKAVLDDNVKQAKALTAAKDAQEWLALQSSMIQPGLEKALSYSRGMYEAATETQAEINKLVEEQFSEFNKNMVAALDKAAKSAPAGSDVAVAAVKSAIAAANSAYDTMTKAAKQVAEMTEASVAAATSATAHAVGSSPSKKKAA